METAMQDKVMLQGIRQLRKHQRPYVVFMLLFLNSLYFLVALGLQIANHRFGSLWDILLPSSAWDATDIQLGAIIPSLFAHGQYWRLFTYMFLHIGVIHFLLNMSCFVIGAEVERIFGSLRFLVLYLASGLVGGLGAWVLISWIHTPLAAGASAALYGICMADAMISILHYRASRHSLRQQILELLAFYVLFAFIGNPVGHLAGAAIGAGLTVVYMSRLHREVLASSHSEDASEASS